MNLPATLLSSLTTRGYLAPTAVQSAVADATHSTHDLLVSAETGSGKTVAFGISMATQLLDENGKLPKTKNPLALVVAPTRELALQVQQELNWLYADAGVRTGSCVGGTDMRREMQSLAAGVHIVVGTPGRLVDHLDRGSLKLDSARVVVLDEADEMLDMGFRDDLESILKKAPSERRTLLFSATIPREIEQLATKYQKGAHRIAATNKQEAHRDIEYRSHPVTFRDRERAVVNVLRYADSAASIVFCMTREGVNHLHASLVERGFSAVALSGELTQAERNRALKALRDGRARVLVATDVAARGLDLPDVSLIIHADLPFDSAVLQHRSGRTGRAGKKGVSVLLVPDGKRRLAEKMLGDVKVKAVFSPLPTQEQIRTADESRLFAELSESSAEPDASDLIVAKQLLEKRTPENIAAALVSVYRQKMAVSEDVSDSLKLNWWDKSAAPSRARISERGTETAPREQRPMSRFAEKIAESRSGRSYADKAPRSYGDSPRSYGDEKPARAPRARSESTGDSQWFKMSIGRDTNADPKWLIPLLCRRGKITKEGIGSIRIQDKETFVEIQSDVLELFEKSIKLPDKKDGSVIITKSKDAPPAAPRSRGPRKSAE